MDGGASCAARRVSAVSVVSGLFIGTVHLFTSILVPTCWSVYRAFDRSSRNACFLRAMDFYVREELEPYSGP